MQSRSGRTIPTPLIIRTQVANLYTQASKCDHFGATLALAALYREGRGVSKSEQKAFELCQSGVAINSDHTNQCTDPTTTFARAAAFCRCCSQGLAENAIEALHAVTALAAAALNGHVDSGCGQLPALRGGLATTHTQCICSDSRRDLQHGGKYGLHLAAESANKETVMAVLAYMQHKTDTYRLLVIDDFLDSV
jgi:TPR repeat protein